MKLYKKLVYRLALYPVLSALLDGIIASVQILLVSNKTIFDGSPCVAIGFFHQYTVMLKLVCTVWMTFHIFCYAVFYKDMKRLEIVYVVTSLLLPLLLAVIPFTTDTYGLAGSWCWIQSRRQGHNCSLLVAGIVEQLALLYVPGITALLAESVAVVTIVVTLCYRIKRNTLHDNGATQTLMLKQMLPLAAYPIAFCVLFLPPFIYRMLVLDAAQAAETSSHPSTELLSITAALCIELWSVAAGLSLWVHIGVVRKVQQKNRANARQPNYRALLSIQEH